MRRTLAATVLALVALTASPGPVAAHTEVQSAEPGPAAEVDGPIDAVTLTFLDPIQPGATIEVSGPDGAVSTTEPATLDDSGRVLRLRVESIDAEGDYIVRYEFTAVDGDHQRESYRFRVVDRGSSIPVGALVAVGAVVGAVAIALWRRRTSDSTD